MMRRHQRGQALVGVLVVMLILFALAGAVSLATSVLLRQQSGTRSAYTDDFAAQNATADAVSQVAGSVSRCSVTAASYPRTARPPTPLSISFPNGVTDVAAAAYCGRIDQVASTVPQYLYNNLTWGTTSKCIVPQALPRANKVWIFFNARWSSTGGGGYAYVDSDSNPSLCSSTPPTPTSSFRCGQVIPQPPPAPVISVALSCDLGGAAPLYLHIANFSAKSPLQVFIMDQDPQGGSIYLLASATKLRSGPDYEEAILFVSADGSINRLLYEARLP